jgi:hypothetical protein
MHALHGPHNASRDSRDSESKGLIRVDIRRTATHAHSGLGGDGAAYPRHTGRRIATSSAGGAQFDVLVTVDQGIELQQSLLGLVSP